MSEESSSPGRLVLIVNPAAGRGRARAELVALREQFGLRKLTAEIFLTERTGHAAQILEGLQLPEGSTVLAVGGDGTFHEVAVALMGRPGVRLAVLPVGSGNDVAAQLGMPRHVPSALDIVLEDVSIPWDVGQVGPHHFVNSVGFALSAETSYWSQFTGPLKGNLRYLWAVLRAWSKHRALPITFDGLERSGQDWVSLMEIAIGDRCGGGYRLTPKAVPYDGLLDVCYFADVPRWQMPALLPRARNGHHLGLPQVTYQQVGSFRLKLERHTRVHVDGEIRELKRGEHSVRVRPRALHLICNRNLPLVEGARELRERRPVSAEDSE